MRSVMLAAMAVAVLAFGAPSVSSAAAGLTTTAAEVRALTALAGRAEKMTPKALDENVQALIAAKPFAELNPYGQCLAYLLASGAKSGLGDAAAANSYLVKAMACPEFADQGGWSLRLAVSVIAADYDGAALSVLQLAQHWPAAFDDPDLDEDGVLRTLNRVHDLPDGRNRQIEVLEALNEFGWRPRISATAADGLWATLAAGLADDGHTARAAAAAQRIADPWVLADSRADRRFDTLFDHAAARFDPTAALAVDLEARRKAVADHPAELDRVNAYANALATSGHPDLELKVIDDALARVAAAPKGKPAYTDLDEKLLWAHDTRARALFDLGRDDDALAESVATTSGDDPTGLRASLLVNLADLYNRLGRPRDALAAADRIDPKQLSPYGLMMAEWQRAWAWSALGDQAALTKALAYIKDHEKDAPASVPDIMIAVDHLDEAAAIYIRRLADPDERLRTLHALQIFADSPNPAPALRRLAERKRALLARPDVKAAIDKVGRVNSYAFMDQPS